jgi:hypothetical protein
VLYRGLGENMNKIYPLAGEKEYILVTPSDIDFVISFGDLEMSLGVVALNRCNERICIWRFTEESMEWLYAQNCIILGMKNLKIVKEIDCKTFVELIKIMNE